MPSAYLYAVWVNGAPSLSDQSYNLPTARYTLSGSAFLRHPHSSNLSRIPLDLPEGALALGPVLVRLHETKEPAFVETEIMSITKSHNSYA